MIFYDAYDSMRVQKRREYCDNLSGRFYPFVQFVQENKPVTLDEDCNTQDPYDVDQILPFLPPMNPRLHILDEEPSQVYENGADHSDVVFYS